MNAIEVLKKARSLIVDKKDWCKGSLYRSSMSGKRQYCVLGAINMANHGNPLHPFFSVVNPTSDSTHKEAVLTLNSVCKRLFGGERTAVFTNNELGHDAIILALDVAIGDLPDHAIKERDTTKELQNV